MIRVREMTMVAARDNWTYVLGLFALGNLANGLWMLADAPGWFTGVPAAVPDFGPLNEHFVRDVGAAYVTMGAGLGWAAFQPGVRVPVVGLVTVFYGLHALAHVYETMTARVGPEHWGIDFLPVYLPAIVLVWMVVVLARQVAPSR
jgi:hypothetical protein